MDLNHLFVREQIDDEPADDCRAPIDRHGRDSAAGAQPAPPAFT